MGEEAVLGISHAKSWIKPNHNSLAPPSAGLFIAAVNALSSCTQSMPVYTLTTVTLLTELLLALRENNPEGFKQLLTLGLQELDLDVANELMRVFLMH